MSAAKDGGPAFARAASEDPARYGDNQEFYPPYDGMTLRDYFAAKAMQAAISGHIAHYGHDNYWSPKDIANYALECADAMLAAREAA